MEFLNTNHTTKISHMKTMIQLLAGATLKTVAAPLVVAGRASQAAGDTLTHVGAITELKGLRLAESGDVKVVEAKVELTKSRAERKAERAERKAERVAKDRVERLHRIKTLEQAAYLRRELAKVDVAALREQLGAFAPAAVQ